jgi:hypothetical protein
MESLWRELTERGAGHRVSFLSIFGYMALTQRAVTIPEIMLIAGTRVALGVGVGLLISGWLNKDQRQATGWALLGVGVLSTFPIVRGLLAKPPVE